MNSHLCNRCGSCVGLSEGAIEFIDREGKYYPKIVKALHDEQVEKIYHACSGKYFDFPRYRELFYPDTTNFHTYTGPYEKIGIGHAVDPDLRINAASGGIITTSLIYLLKTGKIDGAVTTRMNPKVPWQAEAFIATTREEIIESAQSKYCITSVNEILPQMEAFKGKLAYVGIPPQVQSIRKLQEVNDPSVKNIEYIFGPFYGNTLHFTSVKALLRSYKVKDFTQITKLYFRHGEWPGNMRVELKSDKVIELKKFHANYLIPFYILKNSLFCTDLANEFTDLSVGDAWAPVYEERGKGFSLILTRNNKGQNLLNEMINAGWLNFEEITENEAISMHSHGYDLKKRGAFIRIRLRKLFGKPVPDYGYELKDFPLSRYLMEYIISFMFLVLGTWPARRFIGLFSPEFVGKFFEKARTLWKKSSYKIKRADLH
ncbi:MAG: Coenzyme F420 hydrogenase/dehydrogenase, beta subunit C-terminal domain [Bacteroidales bacterium]|nr:Coenzyme F420 hydrogenase/dehydrogenase, beta subunit C-terminal domain [Bacteroidales bacterium]MBN2818207.1 Coenzyme F420 hydrogenase/dehydrogenase, beta subunit C-terminal domain [Bacteroidales bacterium]